MVESISKTTIQDIAYKVSEERLKEQQMDTLAKERTIFVLGSNEVGKSSIINNFLDRDDVTKPTLALEYSYGRRTGTGQGIQKQVCNIWELGTVTNSHSLIEIPMKTHGLKNMCVVIVLNLSQPDRLWRDFEGALNGIKESVLSSGEDAQQVELLKDKMIKMIGNTHTDIANINVLPFPVLIIGGKYDLYQNFDPEIKKHVCRFLRSMSHSVGASLLFYSLKNATLLKTVRDTFNHFGFGSPSHPFRSTITDYNSPLAIWFGQDSWREIGISPTNSEHIGLTLNSHIPQNRNDQPVDELTNEDDGVEDDPAHDPGFREPVIDELRAQKDEELQKYMRDLEVRKQFEVVS